MIHYTKQRSSRSHLTASRTPDAQIIDALGSADCSTLHQIDFQLSFEPGLKLSTSSLLQLFIVILKYNFAH